MTRYRLLMIVVLGIIAAYIITSPETASAGAADFGDWVTGVARNTADAVTRFVGNLL